MKFSVDKRIADKFKGVLIGVLIAKNVNNKGFPDEVISQLRLEEKRIRVNYNLESLSQEVRIKIWREAYSVFGGKPKEDKSSVENLYRRVIQGETLNHINKLVDIYNLISLKYMLPVGGEDLAKIKGDLVLTFASDKEPKVKLLGDKDERPPHKGEVIYKDTISAICRRWNWREADRTKLTEETSNCILVIEGLPPVKRSDIEKAVNELSNLIIKACGGEVSFKILDEKNLEIRF